MTAIWLIRHGETEWSRAGRHTGTTDIPLTDRGRENAAAIAPLVALLHPGLVLSSPLRRAQDTARLAGLVPDATTPDLMEWDYGAWEGRTTAEIRAELGDPNWLIWDHPVPPGATPGEQTTDVGMRADRVIARCLPTSTKGATACWWPTATCCACSPPGGSDCRPSTGACSPSTQRGCLPSASSTRRTSSRRGTPRPSRPDVRREVTSPGS